MLAMAFRAGIEARKQWRGISRCGKSANVCEILPRDGGRSRGQRTSRQLPSGRMPPDALMHGCRHQLAASGQQEAHRDLAAAVPGSFFPDPVFALPASRSPPAGASPAQLTE